MRSEIGEERPFQCNMCEYSFPYRGEKTFHYNVFESTCHYIISSLSQWKNPIFVYTSANARVSLISSIVCLNLLLNYLVKGYVCKYSDMRLETGKDKTLQCNVCEYSFSYGGEKPFQCNVCEYLLSHGNLIMITNAVQIYTMFTKLAILKNYSEKHAELSKNILLRNSLPLPLLCTECGHVYIIYHIRRNNISSYNLIPYQFLTICTCGE